MIRILPSLAALAACTASPQETAMPGSSPDPRITEASNPGGDAGGQGQAAVGPGPEPVSAAENPAPAGSADSPAAADGRRILSTAFVRVGPDGLLTVTLRNGRVLVLRDLIMRRKDYCGAQVRGGEAGARYCGEYPEIAAARPGGAPPVAAPDLADPKGTEAPESPVGRH